MTVTSDIDRTWPAAVVDIGPIELTDHYWGIVGTIPYDGHVVLAVIGGPPDAERAPVMSMYLPNPDLQPTGFEPAEFTDIVHSPRAHTRDQQGERPMDMYSRQFGPAYLRGMPASSWTDATTGRRPLSDQTRTNITRWAQEYISGLVRNHNGDSQDVRSIIDDLHVQSTLTFNGV